MPGRLKAIVSDDEQGVSIVDLGWSMLHTGLRLCASGQSWCEDGQEFPIGGEVRKILHPLGHITKTFFVFDESEPSQRSVAAQAVLEIYKQMEKRRAIEQRKEAERWERARRRVHIYRLSCLLAN